METKTKLFLICAFFFAAFGLLFIFQNRQIGKLRLIACDVGQGDGMLIVTPGGKQIVVDGGPGTKIASCLSAKMPFWDRTIEMMVSTHGEKDHLEGLLQVLSDYKVKNVVETQIPKDTDLYKAWREAVKKEGEGDSVLSGGDEIVVDGVHLKVLWPDKLDEQIWQKDPPSSLNETSIVTKLSYGGFCAYLTGDATKEVLDKVIFSECAVLKVAHHGSKTGTNMEVLEKANPKIAIIQVGKNSYGHPHKEVLDLLVSNGVKILRNDTNGIIEIETNGETYKVKSEK